MASTMLGRARPISAFAALVLIILSLGVGMAGAASAAPALSKGNGNGQGQSQGQGQGTSDSGSADAAPGNGASDHGPSSSSPSSSAPGQSDSAEPAKSFLLTASDASSDKPGNGHGSEKSKEHGHGNDHTTDGNAGTSGNVDKPQPISNADSNGTGANPGGTVGSTDCTGNYCSTRDGTESKNGNGNGNAVGKPCAGCVGKADNKNPHGQYPDGNDHNAGYECDRNHGIGRTNPAHTLCTPVTTPDCSDTASGCDDDTETCAENRHQPKCDHGTPTCDENPHQPKCDVTSTCLEDSSQPKCDHGTPTCEDKPWMDGCGHKPTCKDRPWMHGCPKPDCADTGDCPTPPCGTPGGRDCPDECDVTVPGDDCEIAGSEGSAKCKDHPDMAGCPRPHVNRPPNVVAGVEDNVNAEVGPPVFVAPSAGALPETGASNGLGMASVAGLLLLIGGVLTLRLRRRSGSVD